MTDPTNKQEPDPIAEHLQQLDERIARIEVHLGLSTAPSPKESAPAEFAQVAAVAGVQDEHEEDGLEFRIGQFVIAQVGIVVLVIGIAFLLTLPFAGASAGLLPGIGYVITAVMFGLVHLARRSFNYIARCLLGGGLFLLYFSTLRLHFFGAQPLLEARWMEVILLALAVIAALVVAIRAQSAGLAALGLTLGYATAIVSEQAWFLLPAVLALAVLSVILSVRRQWEMLLLQAILLSYLTYGVWMVNNPIMGGELHLLNPSKVHLLFVLACCIVFGAAGLWRKAANASLWDDEIEIMEALLNAVAGYSIYVLASLAIYRAPASLPHLVASAVLLALASAYWMRRHSRYATFIYAMLGYGALTVAIVFATSRPQVFLWLCWQSMLVLATALWFRSKFIVCGNFAIYVGVLLAYLAFAGQIGSVGLSFGLVALLSARVMNWQKNRLELQTELMRNAYLAVAFVIIPVALWRMFPRRYVALAWLGTGLVYYVLSLMLRNKKYRWMALLTLMLTVIYVFVIGIAWLEPVHRVISFIALGLALLVVSLVYTGIRARRAAARTNDNTEG